MEPLRERIEDFMRRYGYEGNRVLRVLAVAVAILLALRALRVLWVLALPGFIGAMLVVGGGSFSVRRRLAELIPRRLELPPARWWKTVLPPSPPAGRSADSR